MDNDIDPSLKFLIVQHLKSPLEMQKTGEGFKIRNLISKMCRFIGTYNFIGVKYDVNKHRMNDKWWQGSSRLTKIPKHYLFG